MYFNSSEERRAATLTPRVNQGAKNRAKGHDFERKVVNAFRNAGWLTAKRHLEFQAAECKGYDLDNTTPFVIQCKHLKTYAPIAVINEIQAPSSAVPVLITKPESGPTVACLRFRDFMRMVKALKRAGIELGSPGVEGF